MLAPAIAIYIYLRHDAKLKKQQGELNEQEKVINKDKIDKIETEKKGAKKADVQARLTKTQTKRGTIGTLTIYNKGKADAANVRIEIDPNNKIASSKRQYVLDSIDISKFPFDLLPFENSIDNMVVLHSYFPNTLELKLIWNDDCANDYESNAILSIR